MPHAVMNLEEAAEFLHLDQTDVRALATHGELPCEVRADGMVFRRRELKTWASLRILGLRGRHLHDYHSKGVLRHHNLAPTAPIIAEITDYEYMEPHLRGRSKAAVLQAMTEVAERSGLLYDPDDLVEELRQREELCTTGIEGGAAVLHPRFHDPYMVEDSLICVGKTDSPIPFGAVDGRKTDVFFLVCCQDDRTHLHVLARICLVCHGTDLLEQLRRADSDRAMHEALIRAERTVIGEKT